MGGPAGGVSEGQYQDPVLPVPLLYLEREWLAVRLTSAHTLYKVSGIPHGVVEGNARSGLYKEIEENLERICRVTVVCYLSLMSSGQPIATSKVHCNKVVSRALRRRWR